MTYQYLYEGHIEMFYVFYYQALFRGIFGPEGAHLLVLEASQFSLNRPICPYSRNVCPYPAIYLVPFPCNFS